MLTTVQKETLDYLIAYHKKWSFMPSLQEIADAFRVSRVSAKFRVDRLANKGYVSTRPKTARSIKILKRR